MQMCICLMIVPCKVDDFVAIAPPKDCDEDFWIGRVMKSPTHATKCIRGVQCVVDLFVDLVVWQLLLIKWKYE